jgi:hypothetical protein
MRRRTGRPELERDREDVLKLLDGTVKCEMMPAE